MNDAGTCPGGTSGGAGGRGDEESGSPLFLPRKAKANWLLARWRLGTGFHVPHVPTSTRSGIRGAVDTVMLGTGGNTFPIKRHLVVAVGLKCPDVERATQERSDIAIGDRAFVVSPVTLDERGGELPDRQ